MAAAPRARGNDDVTFVTISDDVFFLGTIGLVNSLRLLGHHERVVVLDAGLTPPQQALLAQTCEIVPIRAELAAASGGTALGRSLYKPYASTLDLRGVLVFVDSDIVLTQALHHLVDEARTGKICAFPAGSASTRWFAEWESLLDLAAPPRRQVYVNAGLVVLSVDRWPELIARWWRACSDSSAVRSGEWPMRFLPQHPLAWVDQDALNAILMSEVPAWALEALDGDLALTTYHHGDRADIEPTSLTCLHGGKRVLLLHHLGRPKPWEPGAWRRLTFHAYTALLSRLLRASDVCLTPPPGTVPAWLEPGTRGRLTRGALRPIGTVDEALRRGVVRPLRRRFRSRARRATSPSTRRR